MLVISDAIASNSDNDIYEFELFQGEIITFDIDATEKMTGLDSVLRIFNEKGNELTNNDDDSAPGEDSNTDSFVDFIAPTTGKYYLGVSSFGNFEYDPINDSTNFSNNEGSTHGNYDLTIELVGIVNTIEGTLLPNTLNETEQIDHLRGLGGEDTISGALREDTLFGGAGADILRGNNGNDLLRGGSDNDTIFGGAGDDTLARNTGNDLLYGNSGLDTFVLGTEDSEDTIIDFEDGVDKIMLGNSINWENITVDNGDSSLDTKIILANKVIGILRNVPVELITQADFF